MSYENQAMKTPNNPTITRLPAFALQKPLQKKSTSGQLHHHHHTPVIRTGQTSSLRSRFDRSFGCHQPYHLSRPRGFNPTEAANHIWSQNASSDDDSKAGPTAEDLHVVSGSLINKAINTVEMKRYSFYRSIYLHDSI